MPDVTLTFALPNGDAIHLGPFTPGGSDMGFHAQFTIPWVTPGGPARVRDDDRPDSAWGRYDFDIGVANQ